MVIVRPKPQKITPIPHVRQPHPNDEKNIIDCHPPNVKFIIAYKSKCGVGVE